MITIETLDAAAAARHVPALAEVLVDCVAGGASVSFMNPYTQADGEAFFGRVAESVAAGDTVLVAAFLGERIIGTAQLGLDMPSNQPHRAEVKKLLVHPKARRNGIARALMLAIEQRARDVGRSLLTLDTRSDDAAEPLYESMGYVTAGRIEGWCRDTLTDRYDATTIMYKAL